ncbi:hypothetical protein [uncultured Kordia sp.]|uniref:hypothetical protein n=1 Tax=uncultured Kordia sp. TaxID=507699 RepID=UPI00261CA770|nr:hypothetical protein [uncultured Kordia sp.]
MNTLIPCIIMLFHMNFTTYFEQFSREEIFQKKEPYDLQLHVKHLKDNTYHLIVTMELAEKTHYVSPHSKGDYIGRFYIDVEENTQLKAKGTLLENPTPKETSDPWTGNPVSFVRENTSYQQQFIVTDTNDFTINGVIGFVIEPRCTMENVKFSIVNKSGKLSIQKTN